MLWFNASHERDVVPLLGTLASARRRAPCSGRSSRPSSSSSSSSSSVNEDDAPLFDEAWFMKVNPARPSRFAPPTAREILAPHAVSPAVVGQEVGSATSGLPGGSIDTTNGEGPQDAASSGRPEEKEEEASAETGEGAWQRTLQRVNMLSRGCCFKGPLGALEVCSCCGDAMRSLR